MTRPGGAGCRTAARNTWPPRSKTAAAHWPCGGSTSISFMPPTRMSRWRRAFAPSPFERQRLVDGIGLCNVTVSQIEEARRIVDIDSIQVEASLWHNQQFLSGVVRSCIDNRLQLLAYRSLGGRKSRSRTAGNPVLGEIAAQCGATPFDVALAWLAGLSEHHRPPSWSDPIDTARSIARHRTLRLTMSRCPRRRDVPGRATGQNDRTSASAVLQLAARPDAEVVMIMGLPGAGKSTMAQRSGRRGYLL